MLGVLMEIVVYETEGSGVVMPIHSVWIGWSSKAWQV